MQSNIKTPKLSVILPAYNAELYLRAAIDSILAQTFNGFELIIINDGSSDGTQKIIDSYKDKRMVKIKQENQGLVRTLNKGLKLAKADFIARHDADDISAPVRFKKQFDWLAAHKETVLVGCQATEINESGQKTGDLKYPEDDASLRLASLSYTPFAHGGVMFRKAAVEAAGGYDPSSWPAEDYDLWRRLMKLGAVANLPEALYKFRVNPDGISQSNLQHQAAKVRQVRRIIFKELRPILRTPVTVKRALKITHDKQLKKNALLAARVSLIHVRPLNSLFMLSALLLALPELLNDNKPR